MFCLVPSTAPKNVDIEGILSQSFRINWQPPNNEDQNGIITEYSVRIVNFDLENVTYLNVTDTDITVSNLQPFTQYEVSVAAHTSAGKGPFSAPQIVQTQESGRTFLQNVVIHKLHTSFLYMHSSKYFSRRFAGYSCEFNSNSLELDSSN